MSDHNCKTDDRKLPIDRPCSACSAGDYKMNHHLHCPPFRAVPSAGEPVTAEAELLNYERILRILADFGITETDELKHRLEDHRRWEIELRAKRVSVTKDDTKV